MPQATTSRAQLRYIEESAFGAIPVAGNPFNLRMTGEGLEYNLQTEASKEIRADRMESDQPIVGAEASGPLNFEMSYDEYDDLIQAALQGTWNVYGTAGVGTTFSMTAAATTITAAVAPVGTSAFTGLVKGQWIKVTQPATANDGLYVRLSSSVDPTATVITLDASTPLTIAGPTANSKISASRLVNASTNRSFSFEKAFNDVNQFFAFTGMTPGKLSLSFQSGSMVTGSLSFMGKSGTRAGATALPGAPVASTAYGVMNAVSGVGQIFEGSTLLTSTYIKSLTLDVDNKLRGRTAIGNLGNISIGAGTIEVTGNMEVYLADGTLYDKFINNTASAISLRMVDPAGNGYAITLPRVKYSDAKVVAGGKDQDAMLSLPFRGLYDSTTSAVILIDRFGVAVS